MISNNNLSYAYNVIIDQIDQLYHHDTNININLDFENLFKS